MKKKIKLLPYVFVVAIMTITFPCSKTMAAYFVQDHLIQVITGTENDEEVAVDLGTVESWYLSNPEGRNVTLIQPEAGFRIGYFAKNNWNDLRMAMFSHKRIYADKTMGIPNCYIAYFVTNSTGKPDVHYERQLTTFESAFNMVAGCYTMLEGKDGKRNVVSIPSPKTSPKSYYFNMNFIGKTLGSLGGLLDQGAGEISVEAFNNPNSCYYVDAYLYKFEGKKIPDPSNPLKTTWEAGFIEGKHTPYIAMLRFYEDGSVVLNPFVTLTLTIEGQGTVGVIPWYDPNDLKILPKIDADGNVILFDVMECAKKDTVITLMKDIDVQLKANAAMDWRFIEWGWYQEDQNNPVTIKMNNDKEISAVFKETGKCWGDFDNDDDVDGRDLAHYEDCENSIKDLDVSKFAGSFGKAECLEKPPLIIIDPNIVKVTIDGQGTVEQYPACCDTVELKAHPYSGWIFDHWDNDPNDTDDTTIVKPDGNKAVKVKATFTMLPYQLTSRVIGNGSLEPSSGTYTDTTRVTLKATPDAGYQLQSWKGTDHDGIKNTTNTVTVDRDREVTVTFISIYDIDTDEDRVPDIEEKGPKGDNPNYDGNGDGIADCLQPNVASLHIGNGQYYITLASPSLIQIPEMIPIDLSDLGDVPNPPSDVILWGLFELNFSLSSLNTDGSTTVTIYLPPEITSDTYYKYGPTPDDPDNPHWYAFLYDGQTGAKIQGNIITLYFIDGERGDDDLVADGNIIDIGGPALTTKSHSSGNGSGGCFIDSLK
ncbi:MAG: choice-of-anchor U domain-containing protein [bacterium]